MTILKKLLATALVAPLLLSSFSSVAEEDKGTSVLIPYGMKYLFTGVELTKAQQSKIIELTYKTSQAKKAADKSLLEKEENEILKQQDALELQMQEIVLSESFDENQIRELAKKMADVRVAKHVEKLRAQHELVNLLDAAQKEQVKKNIALHIEKNSKVKADS